MTDKKLNKEIEAAHLRIKKDVRFTPLQYSPSLSNQSNAEIMDQLLLMLRIYWE